MKSKMVFPSIFVPGCFARFPAHGLSGMAMILTFPSLVGVPSFGGLDAGEVCHQLEEDAHLPLVLPRGHLGDEARHCNVVPVLGPDAWITGSTIGRTVTLPGPIAALMS